MYSFDQFRDKRVFITGASGFTGGHLARRLLDLGAQVTLLLRAGIPSDLRSDFEKRGALIIQGDLGDKTALRSACSRQDYVFHIAALFRQAKFPDSEYFKVNFEGTRNVLDAAEDAGVGRVVHCSTNGVHGTIENPPGNEDSPIRPGDVYQVSKVRAEQLVLERVESGQIDAVVIRPAMIWGEGDRRFQKMFKAISRRRFPIIGTGKTLCHWLYVHDLVDSFLLAAFAAAAKGRVYLIAGAAPVTLEQTVQEIANCAGVRPLPFKIPAWPVQLAGSMVEAICLPFGLEPPLHRRRVDFFVKNRSFDISRAKRELGFTPQLSFAEETKRIFTWYKDHGWL